MPDDFPNYMLHSQLLQYLSLYAEHFHLLRYINFQVVEHTKSVTDLSHKQTYVTSKIVTFVSLCTLMIQTRVRSVTQRPDFSLSGQWDVVTMNRDGEEEKHVFDAVLVCSGH